MNKKIAILTGFREKSSVRLVEELIKAMPECEFVVYLHSPQSSLKKKVRNQIKNLKHHGPLWIPYRIYHLLRTVISKFSPSKEESEVWEFPQSKKCSLIETRVLHRKDFLQQFQEQNFNLGVVFGTTVLKEKLFSLPELGMINIHQGIIPDFRGQPPAFWELYTGAKETGVTVHRVSSVLDGGAIYSQERIVIESADTELGLQEKLDQMAVQMLPQVAANLLNGERVGKQPELKNGNCYKKPTVWQRFKLAVRGRCEF